MLLRRKRMLIRCHASGTDQETQREISPMAYQCRDDGYVDAWCHLFAKTCIPSHQLRRRVLNEGPD